MVVVVDVVPVWPWCSLGTRHEKQISCPGSVKTGAGSHVRLLSQRQVWSTRLKRASSSMKLEGNMDGIIHGWWVLVDCCVFVSNTAPCSPPYPPHPTPTQQQQERDLQAGGPRIFSAAVDIDVPAEAAEAGPDALAVALAVAVTLAIVLAMAVAVTSWPWPWLWFWPQTKLPASPWRLPRPLPCPWP